MYSGQFLEMYSQSVHAQNLADSEQKRAANQTIAAPAAGRASFTDVLRRHLERVALGRPPAPASSLHAASQLPRSR
jgi:hypothetical protein